MAEYKFFKAKIPFSSEHGIFNPGDINPGFAPSNMVNSWVKAGYAVEVDGDISKVQIKQQEETKTEPVNEPALNETKQEDANVPEEVKEPVNETRGSADPSLNYENMSYPQLKKAAKSAGIKNYHMMKQTELIKALKKG